MRPLVIEKDKRFYKFQTTVMLTVQLMFPEKRTANLTIIYCTIPYLGNTHLWNNKKKSEEPLLGTDCLELYTDISLYVMTWVGSSSDIISK